MFGLLFALPLTAQKAPGKASPEEKSALRDQQALRPLFLPPVVYGCSPGPFAVADVNGDGKLDVVSSAYGTLCILLGNGDGTFQSPLTYPLANAVSSLALADVNGDGKLDVIGISSNISILNYSAGVSVMLGNGDGTFQPPAYFGVSGQDAVSVAVADLNGDGKPDIVGTTYFGGISVLLGNGDGTFQPAVLYSPGGASLQAVIIADVNGDGVPDLLADDECGVAYNCYPNPAGTVSVLLGNGDGTFQGAVVYDSGGNGSGLMENWPLTVASLRGSATSDLAVVNSGSNSVAALLGNGDGTFQSPVSYSTGGAFPVSVGTADTNGDRFTDLVVVNSCTSIVDGFYCSGDGLLGVLLGNGDGTFQPVLTYDLGGSFTGLGGATGLVIADLNNDGKPDVITDVRNISVLLNDTGAPPPTITVKSLPDPSAFWQPLTITATLTSSVTPPTGTVNFISDSVQVGSAAIANGTASINLPLTSGFHSISAVYPGSGSLYGNTSNTLHHWVNRASTAVSVVSSADPSARSKPITYTATVTSQYGGAATGSVVFTTGSQVLGTATLSGNIGVLTTTSFSTDGSYPIVATYNGDANNLGSVSPSMIEYVDSITTRTAVTSSSSTSLVGQPVTFTASVTPVNGAVPDGEIVSFYYHSNILLGTASTAAGTASLATSSIPAGNWTVRAIYPGDSTYLSSLGAVSETIKLYSSTTTLSSTPNPSANKQSVVFTATVTSAGPDVPTGTVTFRDGTNGIGQATLSGGVATLAKSSLAVGTHSITATYNGDNQSNKSTSPAVEQVVN